MHWPLLANSSHPKFLRIFIENIPFYAQETDLVFYKLTSGIKRMQNRKICPSQNQSPVMPDDHPPITSSHLCIENGLLPGILLKYTIFLGEVIDLITCSLACIIFSNFSAKETSRCKAMRWAKATEMGQEQAPHWPVWKLYPNLGRCSGYSTVSEAGRKEGTFTGKDRCPCLLADSAHSRVHSLVISV